MNRILPALLLMAVLLAPSASLAAIAPAQFAWGLPLEVPGESTFYQVELPLAVYQGVSRADLGDMRVFNGEGQVVPHALRVPASSQSQPEIITVALPLFLVASPADRNGENLSLRIERRADGAIVEVKTMGTPTGEADMAAPVYLIDASQLDQPVGNIRVSWQSPSASFLDDVILEISDDLTLWRPLAKTALADLTRGEHHLAQQTISFPPVKVKYLRLRWGSGQAPVVLETASALLPEIHASDQPTRQWFEKAAVPVSDREGTFQIELAGAVPVDRVRIRLPEPNTLLRGRLTSSLQAEDPAPRELWRGLVFNLQHQGKILRNETIPVYGGRHRYWTVLLESNEEAPLPIPVMEFGWQPYHLIFLAQGSGPFQLAYGSAEVSPANTIIEELLAGQTKSSAAVMTATTAKAGTPFLLGGEKRRLPAEPSFPWKTYALWGILVFGVLLIGAMAASLVRQMGGNEKSGP